MEGFKDRELGAYKIPIRDREVHWSCWSCMLFHATITNFKKDAQSPFSVFCRVFFRRIQPTDVTTQSFGIRFYGVKKHSPPPKHRSAIWKRDNAERMPKRVNVPHAPGDCKKDIAASSPSHSEEIPRSSNHLSSGRPAMRLSKPLPTSRARAPAILSTKWELYEEILRLVSLIPPAPFSRLMRLHQRHPALQSVESYNLLLHLSIRHSFSRHTRLLLDSMAPNNVMPNVTTEKLVVRRMVITGKWKQAWQQVMARYPSISDIPMTVLPELLAPGTRNFPRSKLLPVRQLPNSAVDSRGHSRRWLDRPLQKAEHGGPAFKLPLDTLILILHRFAQLPLDELSQLPSRVISYAVRGLIRNGHYEPALLLTENHLKSLPPVIGHPRVDFARDLVHLHLSWGDLKLANYKKRRRLVERLFSLHSSLHPNAKTVFLLMRFMERSKRCGIEAYLFFKEYRARWGAVVESLEVRRRIVEYAIKQRKLGIAKEISLEGPLDEPIPSRQLSRSGTHPVASMRMRAWRIMYPRKAKGAQLWKRLVIRLLGKRRLWKRRLPKIPWPRRIPSS